MAAPLDCTADDLARENKELRNRLREAEELIFAVRTGAVDALAIQSEDGPRIFTLEGADQGYRILIEQMNEGAVLLEQDGTILYGNVALARLLSCGLEAIIGQPFERFVPPDFRAFWASLLVMGWHHGQSKGELPLQSQTGTQVPLILSTSVLSFGGNPVLAVIITDLSAQREIQSVRALVQQQNVEIDRQNEELRQQAAARRAVEQTAAEASRLLEGIPQIAWTANPAGNTTYFNRRWYDYTGQPQNPERAFEWWSYQHPAEATLAAERWQHSLHSGEVFDVEFRLRNRAGHYRWMLSRALPSYDEQGNVMQWIGTCTDIHEQKLAQARIDQAQRQLQVNNEQLRRANVDLDNFIYTASHDLKAPINNIEGLLDALLEELPAAPAIGPQVPPLLDMMQDSVDRFKRTLTHLTEVTKLQKEFAAPITQVQLAEIIRDVRLDLAPLEQAVGAQVVVAVAGCPAVPFAEKNLRSVVYNLLSNALKYHSPARPPRLHIGCRDVGAYVVLSVQDNGLGLNVTDNPKLFAMFERFHDHVEGSGIGLYMVKKIVENAGGRIEVTSEVGVGSTFSVYLLKGVGE